MTEPASIVDSAPPLVMVRRNAPASPSQAVTLLSKRTSTSGVATTGSIMRAIATSALSKFGVSAA